MGYIIVKILQSRRSAILLICSDMLVNFPMFKHMVEIIYEAKDKREQKIDRVHEGSHDVKATITIRIIIIT
jgi:hypothetical protein